MIFAEEDLNSLNAIAGLLASFGCDTPDSPEYLPGGRLDCGEQIIAYDAAGNRIWDGVWGWGSYGFEQGLIEVMGSQLLGHDDVKGWLTARQITKMWRCRNAAQNR